MDPTIEQTIAGFRTGIDAQRGRLGDQHPKMAEALALLAELERKGEAAGDVGSFMQAAAAEFQQMSTLMVELSEAEPVAGAAGGGAAPAAQDGLPPPSSNPQVRQIASAHRMAYQQIDKSLPSSRRVLEVYHRLFEIESESDHPATFNRRLAEEGIFAELATVQARDIALDALEQCKGLSIPCMEYHYQVLADAVGKAGSAIEVEYETNRLVELNAVEQEADSFLVHYLTKAIGAVAGLYMDPSPDQQQVVENSYRFVAGFFGYDWDQMFEVPRVWDHWCLLYEKSKKTWIEDRDCHDPVQARDHLTGKFRAVMEGRAPVQVGPPELRTSQLWGERIAVEDLFEVYRNPPRPRVEP